MSRFRSRLSRDASPEDQALQDLIRRAMSNVSEALSLVSRSRSPKTREVLRNLERVMQSLDSVGNLSEPEPDKLSEEEKVRLFKEALKKQQKEKNAK